MKKIFASGFIFILFMTLCPRSFSDDGTLVFVGIDGTIPFSYKENGNHHGIFCDIAGEIIRRMKVDAKIDLLSFALITRYLKDGAVDGCFMIYHNKERETYLMYARTPVLRSSINVYVKKGHGFDFESVTDLYGKRVGKQSNFFTSKAFVTAVENKRFILDEARTCEFNLKKLMAGRIDCYVGGDIGTRHSIKKLGLKGQVVALPTPLVYPMETFFAISRFSKKIQQQKIFIDTVDRIIREMYEDGTIQRIEASYLE